MSNYEASDVSEGKDKNTKLKKVARIAVAATAVAASFGAGRASSSDMDTTPAVAPVEVNTESSDNEYEPGEQISFVPGVFSGIAKTNEGNKGGSSGINDINAPIINRGIGDEGMNFSGSSEEHGGKISYVAERAHGEGVVSAGDSMIELDEDKSAENAHIAVMDIEGEGWTNDYGGIVDKLERGTVVGTDIDGNGLVVRTGDGSTRVVGEVTPRG